MISYKNLKYYFLSFYLIITFDSYLNFLYPKLINILTIPAFLILFSLKFHFSKNRLLISLLLLILYIHMSFNSEGGFSPQKYALLIPFIPLIHKEDLLKTYHSFRKLFIILTIPSLIVLVFYLLGIQNIIPSHTVDIGRPFIIYPGAVVQPVEINQIGSFQFFRISGFQTEPGWLGGICLFILMVERFDFNKKHNLIILLIGLISFSLAFYMLFFSFILLDIIINRNFLVLKKMRLIIFITIILVSTGLAKTYISKRYDKAINSDNIESEMRTKVSSKVFFAFFFSQDTKKILLGNGSRETKKVEYKGAENINYMAYLYDFGIINPIFLFSIIFIMLYGSQPKSFKYIVLVILISSFYQSPYIFRNGHFFLYTMIAMSLRIPFIRKTNTKNISKPISS